MHRSIQKICRNKQVQHVKLELLKNPRICVSCAIGGKKENRTRQKKTIIMPEKDI